MSGPHHPEQIEPLDRHVALERHVAHRIRLRRQQAGLTQAQLAALIGVTYQQVHKYERSIKPPHRWATSRYSDRTAHRGDVFFEDAEPEPIKTTQQDSPRQLVELMDDVLRIANAEYRHVICALAKAMAKRVSADDEG